MKHSKKEYLLNVAPCFYGGVLCGTLVGAFVFFFKWVARLLESHALYIILGRSPVYVICIFLSLAFAGLLMAWMHKKVPEARGGGIPRSEGVLRGVLKFRWLPTLLATFVGSALSFFCGLPLGSEGPSVLMGTSLGALCGKASGNKTTWDRYVMTGGAGAGFAVATGAPLTGILFALEEIHKRFTPMLVLTVSSSVVSATLANRLLCDAFAVDYNLFRFEKLGEFELKSVGYLLLLAVMVALAVALFDGSVGAVSNYLRKHTDVFKPWVKLVFVFVLTGALALTFREGVFSGHHLISELAAEPYGFGSLIAVFLVRLLMMVFMTGSGATGGIFIPTLAIGAAFSALAAKLLLLIGLPEELYLATVLLGMCAFIGGTLRAPLTASVFFIELTLQFTNLLFVGLVVFLVYFITELFDFTPFYDLTLENMVESQNEGKTAKISRFELTVSQGSFVVGKTVRDIMWPASSAVVGVKRAGDIRDDMDNDGEKRLYVGDRVILRARYFDEAEIRALLVSLVGNEHEIYISDVVNATLNNY